MQQVQEHNQQCDEADLSVDRPERSVTIDEVCEYGRNSCEQGNRRDPEKPLVLPFRFAEPFPPLACLLEMSLYVQIRQNHQGKGHGDVE